VRILWFRNCEQDYFKFCKLWCSSAFWAISKKKRLCCGKDPKHKYDDDGHVRKSKCMVRADVVLKCYIYVVIRLILNYGKFGMVSNPDQLCSKSPTDRLVSCYHFSIFCTIVLSLTCIVGVFGRINMVKKM
jgi:hypothetical protein